MNSTLVIILEQEFLTLYPEASVHVLVADRLDQIGESTAEQWKKQAQEVVSAWTIDPQRLVEQAWIAEWRAAIKKMNLNPAKKRSSIEQLAKRALNGSYISLPNPVVNLYCHISTIARAPMGGYDLDKLNGSVRLRLTRQGDQFLGINEQQTIVPTTGTVVYADDQHTMCFAWNHRDSAYTCLSRGTERAVFFADASLAESRSRAAHSISLLADALSDAGADVLSSGILDRSAPMLELVARRNALSQQP